jgi:acyl carrier protein
VSEVEGRLQEIARSVFDDEGLVLTETTQASDVRGWDSLGHVSFMYSVESEFDIEFSEDEYVGFANVGELTRLIETKLTARA